MKKSKDLKDLTIVELQEREDDARKEVFNLRMQQVAGQIEDPLRLRHTRREIARIKTLLNQRRKDAS